MKQIIHSPYARFFFVGFLLTLVCAYCSTGFYHVDEHMQVLEFASWKLGITPISSLPWEFHQQARASLLPSAVFLISKVLCVFGIYNPFIVAFLLRLLTGLSSWFITCLLCIHLNKNMQTEKGKKLFVLMALFLWFIPFLSVRFTSENIAGITFLYGAYFIFRAIEKGNNSLAYLTAGLFFGISFYTRAPLLIAILIFTIWLIKTKKVEWKKILFLSTAILIAIGLNACLDTWFYGEPTFSLWNYVKIYILNCTHGVPGIEANPPWFYIEQFGGRIMPPLSLLLLAAFFIGVSKNRKDPFVWIIIPFFIVHSIIRHKELRFLFPILFIFIYVVALGIDHLLTKKTYLKWHKYIYALFLIIVIPLLALRTITPANISISYCKYIYNNVEDKNTPLFMLQSKDTHIWNPLSTSLFTLQNNDDNSFLMTNKTFYKNPNIDPVLLRSGAQLNTSLDSLKPNTVYYLDKTGDFTMQLSGYKITEVYSFAPVWLVKFIELYTDDKAAGWKIYKLSKT